MYDKGLNGEGRFGSMHPLVATIYYIMVIVLVILSNSAVMLLSAIAAALLYAFVQRGGKVVKRLIITSFLIAAFITVINGFFTHNGATVLFYIGASRITKEAFVYGACMSLILAAIICWFASFNVIMTSDKLIYVFGRIAPVLGLVISMIFRFIPLLKQRFNEIKAGQMALGKGELRGVARIRQFVKEVSTLISWSLEASLESSDSMTARGYGLKGRTSYHIFKIEPRDIIVIVITIALGAGVITAYHFGVDKMYYYPVITKSSNAPFFLEAVVYIAFVILMLIPFIIDMYGEYEWKKSVSGI